MAGLLAARLLNTKIDQTQSRLGSASEALDLRWNSPALWGIVSEMASFLDTLGEGKGDSHLTEEQEIKINKLVSVLVEVQAKTALGSFREGLIEQKPFILYARGVSKNSIGAQSAIALTLGIRMVKLERSLVRLQGINSSHIGATSHEDLAS